MPRCFVCGRARTLSTKAQNISYHRFAANPEIREKWFDFLRQNGLDESKVTKQSLICSRHFDQSLFISNMNCRALLKTAVPSIMIHRLKIVKAISPKYKVCSERVSTPILDEDKSSVKVSTIRDASEKSITLDEKFSQLDLSMKSNISRPNSPRSCFVENRSIQNNMDSSFFTASSSITVDNTPSRQYLKLKIQKLSKQMATKTKQWKILKQKLRHKEKKIASLKGIILQLRKKIV